MLRLSRPIYRQFNKRTITSQLTNERKTIFQKGVSAYWKIAKVGMIGFPIWNVACEPSLFFIGIPIGIVQGLLFPIFLPVSIYYTFKESIEESQNEEWWEK